MGVGAGAEVGGGVRMMTMGSCFSVCVVPVAAGAWVALALPVSCTVDVFPAGFFVAFGVGVGVGDAVTGGLVAAGFLVGAGAGVGSV